MEGLLVLITPLKFSGDHFYAYEYFNVYCQWLSCLLEYYNCGFVFLYDCTSTILLLIERFFGNSWKKHIGVLHFLLDIMLFTKH